MPPADLAVLGAAIRTLDPARPSARAVAVRDGMIAAVGDDAEVRAHCGPQTELVDGDGIALVPGLVDSHIHPFHGTDGTRGADLNGAAHARRGARRAHRRARALRAGRVGARLGPLLRRVPRRADRSAEAIADAIGDAPAYVTFFDYHSALASRPALALAGVDGPREFGAGAAVVCDDDGAPTGELREAPAMDLVARAGPGAHARRAARRLRGDACGGSTRSG